jgi:hypothetical protein
MDALKNILRFLWEQPASLIGFFVVFFGRGKKRKFTFSNGEVRTYYIFDWLRFSAQWGMVSLMAAKNEGQETPLRHEALGHGKQSTILGPLYLLAVGLPSYVRNRISLYCSKPSSWYYGYQPDEGLAYPEKWADKLGEVKRK